MRTFPAPPRAALPLGAFALQIKPVPSAHRQGSATPRFILFVELANPSRSVWWALAIARKDSSRLEVGTPRSLPRAESISSLGVKPGRQVQPRAHNHPSGLVPNRTAAPGIFCRAQQASSTARMSIHPHTPLPHYFVSDVFWKQPTLQEIRPALPAPIDYPVQVGQRFNQVANRSSPPPPPRSSLAQPGERHPKPRKTGQCGSRQKRSRGLIASTKESFPPACSASPHKCGLPPLAPG